MKTLIFLILLTFSNIVSAVYGPTNFGWSSYPSHSCPAPFIPSLRPSSNASKSAIDHYNRQIRDYNIQLRQFIDCMNDYLEAADKDIQRIVEKAKKAKKDANRVLNRNI